MNNLPLNVRQFMQLAFLAPMATPATGDFRSTELNRDTSVPAGAGQRPEQNNYQIDGIDNNSNAVDFLNGTNFVILPPVDAIQEFKVQSANFSAELGRSAGAVP